MNSMILYNMCREISESNDIQIDLICQDFQNSLDMQHPFNLSWINTIYENLTIALHNNNINISTKDINITNEDISCIKSFVRQYNVTSDSSRLDNMAYLLAAFALIIENAIITYEENNPELEFQTVKKMNTCMRDILCDFVNLW